MQVPGGSSAPREGAIEGQDPQRGYPSHGSADEAAVGGPAASLAPLAAAVAGGQSEGAARRALEVCMCGKAGGGGMCVLVRMHMGKCVSKHLSKPTCKRACLHVCTCGCEQLTARSHN